MEKSLTLHEMKLFHGIIQLAKNLEDCNPEVGMGPSIKQIVRRQIQQLSFNISEDDIVKILEYYK